MSGKVRIELDHDGIRQLLESQAVGNVCQAQAERIAERAGDGFGTDRLWHANFGGGRIASSVVALTTDAKRAEADDKVLAKAVESCRA